MNMSDDFNEDLPGQYNEDVDSSQPTEGKLT